MDKRDPEFLGVGVRVRFPRRASGARVKLGIVPFFPGLNWEKFPFYVRVKLGEIPFL